MSISDSSENSLMLLMFNATTWTGLAVNDTGTPITQIAVALHTADPGDAGSMSTSEAAYGSYARVNVNRNSGGWTVTANAAKPTANIDFVAAASGSETEAYFSTGKTGGGAAIILFSGTVTPNITVTTGVTPRLTTATSISID